MKKSDSPRQGIPYSIDDWELEISEVLFGTRAARLSRLGSVEEYIESLLRLAPDRAASLTNFRHALRRIVQEWSPSGVNSIEYVSVLLDFIVAYRPIGGTSKIVELLKDIEAGTSDNAPLNPSYRMLAEKSITALEKYFPAAPSPLEVEAQELKTYLLLLHLNVRTIAGSSYATKRLLELGFLGSPDYFLEELIEFHSTKDLIAVALEPSPPIRPHLLLSALYFRCLKQNSNEEFVDALKACKADLIPFGSGLAVVRADLPPIVLDLPADAANPIAKRFMEVRWGEADAKGFEKLTQIDKQDIN